MRYFGLGKKCANYIIDILGTVCLTYVLLFLLDMGDELYQTLRNIQIAKAIFMLAVFMFITQRVRLFNWQSLVASLLYWPIGYMYRNRFVEMPHLFNCDRIVAWICWLLLLIVVDMAVYKKVNPLQKLHKTALSIFALMAVFMIFYRNVRPDPIIFVVMFLFYLIPIDKERWRHIIYQFCGAWVLSFVNRLSRSLLENPEVAKNGRWYGCFLNIGDFGVFMAAVVAVSLYLMFCAKQTYGRKSIPYIVSWILMLPVVWTVFRVSTITMFIGIGCVFLMGFIILSKNETVRGVVFRSAVVFISIPVIVMGGLLALRALANTDKAYWLEVLKEGNTFVKPIADIIRRAHSVFDRPRTFADCGVFDEGTLINYLDLLTSGRLSVNKVFSEYFNFSGNEPFGIQVGTYFAYNTHNGYTQFIFEYGYIGGGMFCLWLISSVILSIKQYLREHKKEQILLCVWMAMTAGVLLGERVYLFSPVIVMTLFLIYPLMVKMEESAEVFV